MIAQDQRGDSRYEEEGLIRESSNRTSFPSVQIEVFPFRGKDISMSSDSLAFQGMDLKTEVSIPHPPHPGAFGVARRYDVHTGVDLYCLEGEDVYTIEPGIVVAELPFTGPAADSPHWLDTRAVMVEGVHGVVLYGEVEPHTALRVGSYLPAGTLIGTVVRVLRNDKGRPTSMLHLELYVHGVREPVHWALGNEKPEVLRDPTGLLARAAGIGQNTSS